MNPSNCSYTTGNAIEFQGGHRIEVVLLDPKSPRGAFKVRDYNGTTDEYSEFKEFPHSRDEEAHKYIDQLWSKYCEEPRHVFMDRMLKEGLKNGTIKQVKYSE